MARRSKDLLKRKEEIGSTLHRLGSQIAHANELLQRFAELDAAKSVAERIQQELAAEREIAKQRKNQLAKAEHRHVIAAAELENWEKAGALRRIFMRAETAIRRDLTIFQSRVAVEGSALQAARQTLVTSESRHQEAKANVAQLEVAVVDTDRKATERLVSNYASTCQPLRDELADIAKQLEDIRNDVIRNARIVGATITRTYLRPTEFSSFNTVIIDEASMILLPAVFQAAGLATKRFVVVGDFQQLPPIVQTNEQAISDVLAKDVFAAAGMTLSSAETTPRLVMLDEQFRMDDSICRLVSDAFYKGVLKTHSARPSKPYIELAPLTNRLMIVDTSRVWPFTTRNAFNSRLNLMHGLAIRNLVLHLKETDRLLDANHRGRVGVCTPYAAQARLIRDIFKAHEIDGATVRASTVHGFQGDERELMVLDLVDSVGERNAGIFLQANQLEDVGAKLVNVALSRAKEELVIIANLTFLDRKLPSDAILRGLMHEVQRVGSIIDVREVLALRPVLEELRHLEPQPEVDSEALRTGLFGGKDFAKLSRLDMENCKQSIVVFSGFITPARAAHVGEVFRRKLAEGVKIRCITRPPNRNGTIPEELGREALRSLEGIGVAIDLRNEIHEKVVIIDGRIAWFGSLNPLSHTARTSELMARVDDRGVANHIAEILSVTRRVDRDAESSAFAEAENPRCECGGWSVFVRGKYGPFFRCAGDCGWKQNLDAVRRSQKSRMVRRTKGIP